MLLCTDLVSSFYQILQIEYAGPFKGLANSCLFNSFDSASSHYVFAIRRPQFTHRKESKEETGGRREG